MLGVFLDQASLDRGDIDFGRLRAALPEWRFYPETAADAVVARIRDAAVVVTNKVELRAALLEQATKLELICVSATGTDNVDLDAARARGIAVANVRGYATASVTQHVFALILALATRLIAYDTAVRGGAWARSRHFCLLDYPIVELAGRRLGIVGYGTLGRAVARAAEGFGLEVKIAARPRSTPSPGRYALDALLREVDVLSLHCPLTPQTRNLIGRRELALMQPHALLINTARGGIVDETALAEALKAGRLAGAGVDVLSSEPPPADHPLLDPSIPNLIVTPHTAWASREARQRLVDELAANIAAYRAGKPRNRVV